ncbi:type II toxin-antitoxin system RelE/ParE family toxin [Segnochrobactrum spirostomi]|uniref:Type II toxin-antitoxin system RelE/ParE family toxin n=1 Tax=Segnochrobactrum spirostomi TaxID=2608987 RepID=A0A6A7XZW4_9HYPH|nr:type II toxin-antitoxin system RelE/ParE family toxin [Segnochrobactrum spirostomi]MQT11667.1 type II toxin-antitoxin system RelE/ParE family toxin [Segnochrobactrum spirostomi]
MSRLIVTEHGARGLARCRKFLAAENAIAAERAALRIERSFRLLQASPHIGRPYRGFPAMRELIIPFGHTGYVAVYRYEESLDTVFIVAFRHMREAGY